MRTNILEKHQHTYPHTHEIKQDKVLMVMYAVANIRRREIEQYFYYQFGWSQE
jgi:hypothetical protein